MMQIHISDDFDLEKIATSGQCFRALPLADGSFHFVTGRSRLAIRPLGGGDFEVTCDEKTWNRVWVPYFDLGRDYRAIRTMGVRDKLLTQAMDFGQGIRILRQNPWETTLSFLISQRKTIPAIRHSIEALSARYGVEIDKALYAFPEPQQIVGATKETLREASLGYRDVYILKAIEEHLAGTLDFKALKTLKTPELIAALSRLHGVGIKVASCIALFAFGRIEVAPLDVWMIRLIEVYYRGKTPRWMKSPYAGLYQQYLFYWALRHKQEVVAKEARQKKRQERAQKSEARS